MAHSCTAVSHLFFAHFCMILAQVLRKAPLKTHTMFEALKTVVNRENTLLKGSDSSHIKARKILTKVVNSLTSQSEIGALMACMYLLGHPDHYTSHKFQRFYWKSYVQEVKKAWSNIHNDVTDSSPKVERVVMTKSGNKVVGINIVMDYIYRPLKYENVSLYDWIRRAQKEKMSANQAQDNSHEKEGEFLVDEILQHR